MAKANLVDDVLPVEESANQHATYTDNKGESPQTEAKGWRFWAIFPALCITALLAAVESTVVSTALPFIVHELEAGELYVWFVNVYFLTRYAQLIPVEKPCGTKLIRQCVLPATIWPDVQYLWAKVADDIRDLLVCAG